MAKRTPLPSLDDSTTETPVAFQEAVPPRSVGTFERGPFHYMLHISQRNCGVAAVSVLVHENKFTQKQIDDMVAEACKICDESRLPARRKAMAAAKTPVPDGGKAVNESTFRSDVEFVEGVMMDKWQFKRLNTINSSNSIDPTVLVSSPPAAS